MRGEYLVAVSIDLMLAELPPRARRIHGRAGAILAAKGTTSACAENTKPDTDEHAFVSNYLRVRGEYLGHLFVYRARLELPPRARRIPLTVDSPGDSIGTTSACAENTTGSLSPNSSIGNYLRVRGEYLAAGIAPFPRKELPPRARRIPPNPSVPVFAKGTTSACAENTVRLRPASRHCGNYLRVRGEYWESFLTTDWCEELPPRARRIRPRQLD